MKAPALFARHRIAASIIVMVLFAVAITGAILRVSELDDAEEAGRQRAAVQEAAQLGADFQAHRSEIAAAIRADIAAGRLDEADRVLQKYRPVANGSLDALAADATSSRSDAPRRR